MLESIQRLQEIKNEFRAFIKSHEFGNVLKMHTLTDEQGYCYIGNVCQEFLNKNIEIIKLSKKNECRYRIALCRDTK